jgi:hypothetical protein
MAKFLFKIGSISPNNFAKPKRSRLSKNMLFNFTNILLQTVQPNSQNLLPFAKHRGPFTNCHTSKKCQFFLIGRSSRMNWIYYFSSFGGFLGLVLGMGKSPAYTETVDNKRALFWLKSCLFVVSCMKIRL